MTPEGERSASGGRAGRGKLGRIFGTLSAQSLMLTLALVVLAEFAFYLIALTDTERDQLEEVFGRTATIVSLLPEERLLSQPIGSEGAGSPDFRTAVGMLLAEFDKPVEFALAYRLSGIGRVSLQFPYRPLGDGGSPLADCRGIDIPQYDMDEMGALDYLTEALHALLNEVRTVRVRAVPVDGFLHGVEASDSIEYVSVCLLAVQDVEAISELTWWSLLRALTVSLVVSVIVSAIVRQKIANPLRALIGNIEKINENPGRTVGLARPSSGNLEIRAAEDAVVSLENRLQWLLMFKLKVESISHDLANRLNTEALLLRELTNSDRLDRQLLDKLANARESTKEVLNGILDGVRFSTEGPVRKEIGVKSLLERLRDQAFPSEKMSGNVEVSFPVVDGGAVVWAEQRFLFSALFNIADNAANAIAADGAPERGTAKIEVRFRETAKHSVFEIADTGPGIPPGLRDRLFRLPMVVKNREVHRVGLSDADFNIRMHGGSIAFETRHRDDRDGPTGTTFTIMLPRRSAKG